MKENKKPKIGILLPILLAILAILVIGFFGFLINSISYGGGCSNSSYNANSDNELFNAWICAQDIVEKKLKSPSTAKFPTYSSKYVTSLGNSKYKIEAYVDAQNSFGATLRKNFTITLTLSGNGYKESYCVFD